MSSRVTGILSIIVAALTLLLLTPSQTAALASPQKTTSLVTGANGYLGKAIVHSLLEQNISEDEQEIFCLVRPARVADEQEYWKNENCVTVKPYDMLDGGASVREALESCSSKDLCVPRSVLVCAC